MDGLSMYFAHVLDCLKRIDAEERDSIERAARMMAERIHQGRVIHCFGPGVHSFIGAEEMFYRKGGLIPVRPYLAVGLSALVGARIATLTEGKPDYADAVLDHYGLAEGDVLLIFNAYGFNACAVQAALRARQIGAKSVALTSPDYAQSVPPNQPNRHPSGKSLPQVADVIIDIKMAVGETVVPIERLPGKAGGTATVLHAYVINCLAIRVAELISQVGETPPIWCVEYPQHNEVFLRKFASQMVHF